METFDAYVEISSKSRVKYEYDFKLKKLRFDRLLYSSLHYPAEYGFIPETLAEDGDALDVLVITTEPFTPGVVVELKAIGVFYMVDGDENDDKIICVPVADSRYNKMEDLADINEHFKKEVEEFFRSYKTLENKKVETGGFGDKAAAERMIQECRTRYNNLSTDKRWMYQL